MMAVLYLFDIDGTMADMTSAHVKAYKSAYRKVAGINVSGKFLTRQFGKIENDIQKTVFRHYGLADNGRINKVTKTYTANISASLKKANIKVLPGVTKMLRTLKEENQPLGVVTGNSRKIGEAILKKTGLYDYFDVYSYGNVTKRAHIARKAIKKARNRKIKFSRVAVIGDSPSDIHAGKKNRAVTVAVATGHYNCAELGKEKPDMLLKSLKDYRKILKRLKS